jgi:hypothetical protein
MISSLPKPGIETSKRPGTLILETLTSLFSVLITENGLFNHWKKETSPFRYKDWQGRISHRLSEETARDILDCFLSSGRPRYFSLFYQSDYKKTYRGKNLLPDEREIYLKFYQLSEAPRKIRIRNVFRRSLARKGFNLYYPLKEKGVKTVDPLFYIRKKGGLIPDAAIYVSYALESNQTLDHLMVEKVGSEKWSRLLMDLGGYVGALVAKGILYGELYRNLIPIDRGDRWEFHLCDLDEMRAISEKREARQFKYVEDFRKKIRFHDPSPQRRELSDLRLFDQAFWGQARGQKAGNDQKVGSVKRYNRVSSARETFPRFLCR